MSNGSSLNTMSSEPRIAEACPTTLRPWSKAPRWCRDCFSRDRRSEDVCILPIVAYEDIAKLYAGANSDTPEDPKVEAQAAAVAKKNGFASLAQYDDVLTNITMIMSGIDPQTKKFNEPPEQIKNEIAALKADKSVPEAEKKESLAQLEAALKNAKPVQFKENIALVLK
jgi:hypothetical protein